MPKKLLWANVRVPESPRVRFFIKAPGGAHGFADITSRVARLEIEELEDAAGQCELVRLDAGGELVWRTRHPSLQETKWHGEFEYGLPEEKWIEFPNG